jgi:hypothetical protein
VTLVGPAARRKGRRLGAMPLLGRLSATLLAVLSGCGGGDAAQRAGDEPPPAATAEAASPVPDDGMVAQERPGSRAVVALERENALAILGGPPWRRIRRVAVASGPHNVDASRGGDLVSVTSPPANVVTILKTAGRIRIAARVRVPGGPHDTAFTASGRRLWVTAERGGRLVQLAMPGGRAVRSVPTSGGPHDLTLARGGRELWITIDGSASVERRSARTGRLLGRAQPGGAPHDLAVSPSGRHVWLSNWSSGDLTVASAATGRAVDRVAAGVEPHHFAFAARRARSCGSAFAAAGCSGAPASAPARTTSRRSTTACSSPCTRPVGWWRSRDAAGGSLRCGPGPGPTG